MNYYIQIGNIEGTQVIECKKCKQKYKVTEIHVEIVDDEE